jgi:HPt (histidine-containing phosphotransfer) domain-containing protein
MTTTHRADRPGTFAGRLLERIRQVILPPGIFPSRRPRPASGVADDDLKLQSLGQQFRRELQARLLEEIPGYRREIASAHEQSDSAAMRNVVHRLLGAAVYCDLDTLVDDLRDLQLALRSQDRFTIEVSYSRLVVTMDALMARCKVQARVTAE